MPWTVWRPAQFASSIRRGAIVLEDLSPPIWTNPSNVIVEDDTDADTNLDKQENSYWLRAYTFGMLLSDIPSGDYIFKVAFRFRLKAQYTDYIEVNACYLDTQVISGGGTPAGANVADGYLIPTSYVKRERSYTMFEWDWDSLTDADIRSTDFSAYLSLYNTQTSGNANAYCDVVECRVFRVDPSNVLTVKTPQLALTGLKTTSLRTAHVNTPELTIAVRGVNTPGFIREVVLHPKVPNLTPTGVVVTARLAYVALVGRLWLGGVKAYAHYTNVEAWTSNLSLTGIGVGASAHLPVKTSSMSFTGVQEVGSRGRVRTASLGLVANHVTDSLSPDGTGNVSSLKLYYSGVSTEDQYDSLGGVLSIAEGKGVYSKYQHIEATVMTGATIMSAYGNPPGETGRLDFTLGPPEQYTWTPHGYSVGDTAAVDISSGAGDYILGDEYHGFLKVSCDGAYPAVNTFRTISVNNPRYRLFRVATPLDCHFGQTSYRCFYIKNLSGNRAYRVSLWIDPQPAVATDFQVGVDPAGEGDGSSTGVAQSIADEYTTPSGVSFISPTENAPLVVGSIQAGNVKAIWVKRTVAANTTDFTLFNSMKIHIGAFI